MSKKWKTGKTLNLSVRQTIRLVLERNESLPKKDRKTDPEIADFLDGEFGRKPYFRNVSNLRAMFNRGEFTGGEVPKKKSRRYNPNGQAMPSHARY